VNLVRENWREGRAIYRGRERENEDKVKITIFGEPLVWRHVSVGCVADSETGEEWTVGW